MRPARSGRFPWYDSAWLERYLAARDVVAATAPAKLAQFVDAFRVLRTRPDFRPVVLQRPFEDSDLARVRSAIAGLGPDELQLHEAREFRRYVVHDHPLFTQLAQRAVPVVSAAAGEPVEPAYGFLSLYAPGGVCPAHLDSPEAKWTLDLCIEQTAPWPLQVSRVQSWEEIEATPLAGDWAARVRASPGLGFAAVTLAPGEAVVFSGSAQWHYRDPLPPSGDARGATFLFLHFVPAGTAGLLRPGTWAARFGLPQLAMPAAAHEAQVNV